MNFSLPFIERPIATTLLSIGVFLVGAVAYNFLPVAALPSIEYPTIHVSASRPGADPSTMAATVAAPLERRLGEIPGVIALTSTSSLGTASISVQFDIGRKIDNAARDVQAALNAAVADLPGDLPNLPNFRKANPNATPILILALTSDTRSASAIYDIADTVIAQRLSQVDGAERLLRVESSMLAIEPSRVTAPLADLTTMSRYSRGSRICALAPMVQPTPSPSNTPSGPATTPSV